MTNTLEQKLRYRTTEFLAWDGEGVTDHDDTTGLPRMQRYVVFGNSGGMYVRSHDLSTTACFDLLLAAKEQYPKHTFVGFATNYDVNMMVRDMSTYHVAHLWKTGKIVWNGYHLRYIPGKLFSVSRKGRKAAVLYDVFSFFGTSFVKSLRAFGVGSSRDISDIEYGKSQRGKFTDSECDTLVIPYWKMELELLVSLCEALRGSLNSAGIHLKEWYGPGAVANQVLNRNRIRQCQNTFDEEIIEAACNAYAGGRFEQFKLGRYVGKVYQYDIRSAYPAAIVRLPALSGARWEQTNSQHSDLRFYDLCRITFDRTARTDDRLPWPFHWRFTNGNVAFPSHLDDGWHYGSVVKSAQDAGVDFRIEETYFLEHNGYRPFEFVEEMYNQRAQWKRDGNPAQYAAKIALNSLYGKFAQQVGATEDKPPKFHQIEWAGMITAQTRARIYTAMMQKPHAVIACETDSVFSTEPLNLPIGDQLGEWELTEHDEIIYLQSGVYFTASDRHMHWKYRGMDRDGLSYDRVCEWLHDPSSVSLSVPMVRFMGMGGNLNNGHWCKWLPLTKTLDPLSTASKRIHQPSQCSACQNGKSFYDGLHDLVIHPFAGSGPSATHKLEWRSNQTYLPRRDEILSDD